MKELEKSELIEIDGGLLFLAAIPLVKVFVWGVATGITIGLVVLDHILDEK
jgi:hypothetical protein